MAEGYESNGSGTGKKTVTRSGPTALEKRRTYEGRVNEKFLLDQYWYHTSSETHLDAKTRIEDSERLYKGDLAGLFPDETALPDVILVENKFKNALHDHSRLAAEGRGMPKFIPRGDKAADRTGARVREAIDDTYWVVGRGKKLTRPIYMDFGGTGFAAIVAYYDATSIYPQYSRLDPRFCYADVRNGKLHSLVYIESVKERVAAHEWPDIGLDDNAKVDATVDFVAYYGADEVCESFIKTTTQSDGVSAPVKVTNAYITQRWVHGLGRVPVAYHQLATYDGAPRGLFDQLGGPMMVRNKAIRFAVDYMEQMAHASLFAQNIKNADETPGPLTVYVPNDPEEPSSIERIAPAGQSSSFWNLIGFMGDQEDREAIQPAGRQGTLPQSQASGSFSNSTQGMLTSVIIEMQEGMADLREQLNVILNIIDEKYLDVTKPLIRSVGKKKTYTPSRDIDGWYYHTVEFGAGAGLDKLNTDNRILNLVAGRLIDRGTAREQVDFIDDSTSIQEKIDGENIGDALLERFATDPSTPLSSLAKISVLIESEGLSKIEALKQIAPELFAAEQAAQGVQPPQEMQPGMDQGMPTAEGALPAEGAGETPVPKLPSAPMAQYFGNQGIRR